MSEQSEQHARWSEARQRLGFQPASAPSIVIPAIPPPPEPEPPEPAPSEDMPIWDRIAMEVARKHRMPLREMLDYGQSPRQVNARAELYWRCRTETKLSFPQIGARFGRHYTSVLWSVRQHQKRIDEGSA